MLLTRLSISLNTSVYLVESFSSEPGNNLAQMRGIPSCLSPAYKWLSNPCFLHYDTHGIGMHHYILLNLVLLQGPTGKGTLPCM